MLQCGVAFILFCPKTLISFYEIFEQIVTVLAGLNFYFVESGLIPETIQF